MRYTFIHAHQQEFPIRRMCQVLAVSASGYYAWRERPESARAQANRKLLAEIRGVHERSRGIYGSPRVYADLQLRGFRVGRNRIARLMRLEKICGRRRKKSFRARPTASMSIRWHLIVSTASFTLRGPTKNGWRI